MKNVVLKVALGLSLASAAALAQGAFVGVEGDYSFGSKLKVKRGDGSKDSIKKAKIATGMYTIYHQGGLMAGYTQFATLAENDEKFLAYIYQPEEYDKFDKFFKKFSSK